MIKRLAIAATATLALSACAPHMNTDSSKLDEARKAIADAKAAGAESCAPKLQAEAVASYYWAAHELTEGDVHPDENASLIATAVNKANEARKACSGKPAKVEIISLEGVYFDNDSANLRQSSVATLDKAVTTLKARANIRVEVAAHTDSSGSDGYNMALSTRRAASVMDYLVAHGIDASRLSSKGYGETQPVADNTSKEGRAKNRRVELRVLK
ncbi:OmpA family protein [Mariprofundus erugo]|uniref:OmpA family protein n=1 Tax=Mariprofundus erugo TaxID=2528639 RepID=A0A5R9GY22_9PROT|nr:OmpA family protein [Mariprofundus erugo]TLS69003.1 OmpA family protein [Mariprofundus erugo]TLS74191.1 OmpA family protein [Mariprofundus erugo]